METRRKTSQELGVEAFEPQPVGDYGRWVGPDLRAGPFVGGGFGDLPLPRLCTASVDSKFLVQVTEAQVL